MHESFIFTLFIVVVIYVLILYFLYKPDVKIFNKTPTNGEINSITNGPIHGGFESNLKLPFETIINSLDIYDETPFTPCGIKVNGDMTNNSPILTPHNELKYLQPNSSGEIVVRHGEWVSMRCGDAFAEPYDGRTLRAQCAGDKNFRINDQLINFANINCTTMSMPTPMRTGLPCIGGTEWLTFGNEFDGATLPTIRVCYDETHQTTPYVEHTINAASIHNKHGVPRKKFTSGDFFGGRSVDEFYKRARQIETLSRILGKDASIYVTAKNYLSRGHLVAKADLIFSGPQRSTFHFVNVVPQWQSFNSGNWSRIEDDVREFAHDNNTTLLCWTGTWGICTLPDNNGIQRELYLINDEQNNNAIPVPRLFYRIVIDAESRKGIALVGVNNPYLTDEEVRTGEYVIAEDVSHNINWIKWDKESIEKGYCYACSVPNFVAVVNDLPRKDLKTTGILGMKELAI